MSRGLRYNGDGLEESSKEPLPFLASLQLTHHRRRRRGKGSLNGKMQGMPCNNTQPQHTQIKARAEMTEGKRQKGGGPGCGRLPRWWEKTSPQKVISSRREGEKRGKRPRPFAAADEDGSREKRALARILAVQCTKGTNARVLTAFAVALCLLRMLKQTPLSNLLF